MKDINSDIKAEASRLGFLFSGITLPLQPLHYSHYLKWLRFGFNASMGYMATERATSYRNNPLLILPQCKTIISFAYPYPSALAFDSSTNTTAVGRVASYAWIEDYHITIHKLFSQLITVIERLVGRSIQYRIYTDTGALLERDYALSAGLGWIGRNTCLITKQSGSFVFLSEILLDVEIQPDNPISGSYCGNCRRCIEICPTQCLTQDFLIDANRCLSYLTIENKGPVPREVRPSLSNWIFGCDLCQIVCPWNIHIIPNNPLENHKIRVDWMYPTLITDLLLTQQGFKTKFMNSAIQRATRKGYLRNIAIALGNMQDSSSIKYLDQVLSEEPEPLVRSHSAWALGKIATKSARLILIRHLLSETHPNVQDEIKAALDN